MHERTRRNTTSTRAFDPRQSQGSASLPERVGPEDMRGYRGPEETRQPGIGEETTNERRPDADSSEGVVGERMSEQNLTRR